MEPSEEDSKVNTQSVTQNQTVTVGAVGNKSMLQTGRDMPNDTMLHLSLVEGTSVPTGTVLRISKSGLCGGLRNQNDGVTFLGSQAKIRGIIANDFVIDDQNERIGARNSMIKFDQTAEAYLIKDLGEGSGTFARLDCTLPLPNNKSSLVTFGETHLNLKANGDSLNVKTVGGLLEQNIDQSFLPSQSPVVVGRLPDCSIQIPDKGLSRYQCRLFHDNGQWHIEDGDGTRISTNGTWLFLQDFFKLQNGTHIKIGQNVFRADII